MSEDLRKRLEAAVGVLGDIRVRWLIGRSQALLESGTITEEGLEQLMRKIMREELERWLIMNEIERQGPLSVKDLSKATRLPEQAVVKHLLALRRMGRVAFAGEKENMYLYELVR
ncbi:MAG: ArsR family transcriptional regulator [Candidatus Freyarchaeota archaeon]|nr:ArsR family transcriptional regulator [Candidatus Jordarchaeia archaeon]MBS7267642.1 ArsR family transcriptional regulator [Candidatus Jordarchaeia archaeon]MBS7278960.1 ArsR family transcriptional regulator [Candidatus Jordarchaeia archaeon]